MPKTTEETNLSVLKIFITFENSNSSIKSNTIMNSDMNPTPYSIRGYFMTNY